MVKSPAPKTDPAFESVFEFLSNSELKYSGWELHFEKQFPETVVHKVRALTNSTRKFTKNADSQANSRLKRVRNSGGRAQKSEQTTR